MEHRWILVENGVDATQLNAELVNCNPNSWSLFIINQSSKTNEELRQLHARMEPINWQVILRKLQRQFMDDYTNFIDKLHRIVNNPIWHTTDIATKNPLNQSGFLEEIAYLYYLTCCVDNYPSRVIVYNLSKPMLRLVKKILKRKNIYTVTLFAATKIKNNLFYNYFRFNITSLVFLKKWLARTFKTSNLLPPNESCFTEDKNLFIISYLFSQSHRYSEYDDPIFSPLIKRLSANNQNYNHILISSCSSEPEFYDALNVAKANDALLVEHFIKPVDIVVIVLKVFYFLFVTFIKLSINRLTFLGESIKPVVLRNFLLSVWSGTPLTDTIYYYLGRNLFRLFPNATVLYPFENLSWERLLIYGARKSNHLAKLVAFQHSSLTGLGLMTVLDSTGPHMALPSKIISTGINTRAILNNYFNWPSSTIEVGCSTRQLPCMPIRACKVYLGHNQLRLLVLTSSINDTRNVLNFLKDVNLDDPLISELRIRFHPLLKKNIIKCHNDDILSLGHKVKIDNHHTLRDSLLQADIVIYSASTAAIEAVMFAGTPLIFLDFGGFLNLDPLFETSSLKRTINNGHSLLDTAKELRNLQGSNYVQEWTRATKYLSNYFTQPSNLNLDAFIQAIYN